MTTGEKCTARGLLDQLGHLPSYPFSTTSRPKFVMDTKKQNEYRGLYGEARRVLETWAKLGTYLKKTIARMNHAIAGNAYEFAYPNCVVRYKSQRALP